MQKDERIVRYTAEELDELLRRGEDQTDFARLDAMTEEELEASIDWEEEGEFDLSTARPGIPAPPRKRAVWFDRDVVAWFEAQGARYQARMNAVLRDYVEANRRSGGDGRQSSSGVDPVSSNEVAPERDPGREAGREG